MDLVFDDEPYQVKGRYLGPDDITLPFQPEFPTLAVGFVLTIGFALIAFTVGINPSFGAALGIVLTGWVMKRVDADRPVLKSLTAELREATRGHHPAAAPSTIRIRTGAVRATTRETTR